MLGFFRRIINSKVGVIVTFAVLIVIAVAFGLGDVTGFGHGSSGGLTPQTVASVGDAKVTEAELKSRTQNELQTFRQQQPTLDMATFIAGGGLDGTLQRLVNGLALEQFAGEQGMVASKRAVDGQIASFPSLQGPNGKFSEAIYKQVLAQQRITDAQIRSDIRRDMLVQMLTAPTVGAGQVPDKLVMPFADLALERRQGAIALVPTEALMTGGAVDPQAVARFYAQNKARYIVPERRVIRYAMVSPDTVKAQATPTDADIRQAYQQRAADFQPKEERTIQQLVVLDQATANGVAAKIKGGTPIAAAAKSLGLEPATLTDITKQDYAAQTSADLANAAFSAARGAVVGPVKTALGYTVAQVQAVKQVPGKSLEQARPELAKAVAQQKTAQALTALRDQMDNAIGNNANFSEVAGDAKLQTQTTAPLTASGTNPDASMAPADPKLQQIVAAAFQAEPGDEPQLVPTGQDGSFALVALDKVIPAAPRPLDQIRQQVVQDYKVDTASKAARQVAQKIIARVDKGATLAAAVQAAGVKLPGVQPLNAQRQDVARTPEAQRPPLALMFSMAQGTAKVLEASNDRGWFIVALDKIVPGSAKGNTALITAAHDAMAKALGNEYAQQFTEAVRRQVGVKTNATALAEVKGDLAGAAGAATDQP